MSARGDRTVTTHDDPLERLAALDPVGGGHPVGAAAGERAELVDALVGTGTVVALDRRRRSGTVGLLVAASVAALLVTATAVVDRVPGGLAGVRAAALGSGEASTSDRDAERAAYDAWVDDMVTCLRGQYGDAVVPVPGGYHLEHHLLVPDRAGNTSFGERECLGEVGQAPRPAPLTDDELGQLYAEQVTVAGCLTDLGYAVGPAPSPADYAAQWRATRPAAPPWTPYAAVGTADLRDAQQTCGLPAHAAPPAWMGEVWPDLNEGRRDATGQTLTPAVAFVDDSEQLQSWADCLEALGVEATAGPNTLSTQNDDVALDDLCQQRHPVLPPVPDPFAPPVEDEFLEVLYEYRSVTVRDCLREQGVEVPEPPSREEFLADSRWNPYASLTAEDAPDLDAVDRLREVCGEEYPPQ